VAIAVALASFASTPAKAETTPTTLTWKGITWNVKSGSGVDPGLNTWSPANAFVDGNGDLHLAITKVGEAWYCSEVWTDLGFPFGTFQWQLASPVDKLDPNVVLGLFVYGPTALGPDGTHEIDIEYARFGTPAADNGWWTIWPNVIVTPPLTGRMSYSLALDADPTTTSRFAWSSTAVAFATFGGFQPLGSTDRLIHSWTYQPTNPDLTISQSPMPVHMNLWLYRGSAPTDRQGVEVVIHDFSFTPSATPSPVPALPGPIGSILGAGLLAAALLSRTILGRHRSPEEFR
jgi:hypothetical protein